MSRRQTPVRLILLFATVGSLLLAATPSASAAGHVETRFGPLGLPVEPTGLSFGDPLVLVNVDSWTGETMDVFQWTTGAADLTASLLWPWPTFTIEPGALSGGTAVYGYSWSDTPEEEPMYWGVWARDVGDGSQAFPIAAGVAGSAFSPHARISGNTVVWNEKHGGQWDIRAATFDPLTHVVTRTFWVAHRSTSEKSPSIAGDWVVWMDRRSGNYDIYARNLTTGKVKAICTGPATQEQPWTDGTWVVWRDWRNRPRTSADIYGRRLAGSSPIVAICRARRVQDKPRVSAGFVVWTDWRRAPAMEGQTHYGIETFDTDIYAWDTLSRNVFRVAGGPAMEHSAETANGTVMYIRDIGKETSMGRPRDGTVWGATLSH